MIQRAVELIKKHEGYSDTPYVCPAEKWTIGYGYNYQDRGFTTEELTELLMSGFDKEIAERLLEKDVLESFELLKDNFEWFDRLDEGRKIALLDMIYNLGLGRFKKFRKMLSALQDEDFDRAAEEAINSRWYKQVKTRGERIVHAIRTGEIK